MHVHVRVWRDWGVGIDLANQLTCAASGFVRAPVSTTAMQVASRLLLVWAVVNSFPGLATSAAYSSMLVAWGVTEVIRYSYFVLSLSGYQPALITWLRYNAFFVLYPMGISSECWLIYKAIEPARRLRQEYAWALQMILLIYIPGKHREVGATCCANPTAGSYILFTHMMAQRRKIMRGKQVQKAD